MAETGCSLKTGKLRRPAPLGALPALLFGLLSMGISLAAHGATILVWGDSLSAAYNLPVEKGWVSLLQDRVQRRDIKVINGSIPGATAAGGARRIDQALNTHAPALLILALGANDGLQGKAPAAMREQLEYIINAAQTAGAKVLLLGMQVPPNYGKAYSDDFAAVFAALAADYALGFVPFLLEPVALDFDLFQADGLHPTAAAQPQLLEHVWPQLEPLLPEQR